MQAQAVPALEKPTPLAPEATRSSASFLRANMLFRLVLVLLVLVVLSAFLLNGVLAWSVGLIYIAYDSWLLWYMVRSSRKSVRRLEVEGRSATAEGPSTPLRAGFEPCATKALVEPKISVLVSAYNEHLVLPDCIRALAAQTDHPDEIIIIDDGSRDNSIEYLTREFQLGFRESDKLGISALDPAYKVWRKEHSGKANSLNQVWPIAKNEIVVTLDADTVLEPHAIAEVRRAFAENQNLAAACGVLTPVCRGRFVGKLFEFYQRFEYYRAFLWRLAWTSSDSLLLVSGAFAAYRKDVLAKLGGYDAQSLVEDYDLIYRVHRYAGEHNENLQVQVISSARATTDAPNNIRAFLNQRARWFSGFLQTLSKNTDMVGSRRFGRVGKVMLPIKTVDTLLPIYAIMAAGILIFLLLLGNSLDPLIVLVLIIKLIFDLVFHCRAIYTYEKWQGVPGGELLWMKSVIATITEPFAFQILRHTGALLGWIAFLRGRARWVPQRG